MPSVSMCGNHNITFVQIPKNAGTSIGQWLTENKASDDYREWYNHPSHSEIHSKDNFSFTVVRNPWDRMVSLYFFLKHWTSPIPNATNSRQIRTELYRINNYDQFPEFDIWLKNIETFKMLPWIKWKPTDTQISWLDIAVDHIIRYENLENDFHKIQSLIDCHDPLPRLLITNGFVRNNYKDYYNTETIRMVENHFKEDIEKWQYEF